MMHRSYCAAVAVTVFGFAAFGCSGKSAEAGDSSAAPAVTSVAQSFTAAGPATDRAIPCATNDVRLSAGKDNGDFNGMSHSGTYLILTNRSRNPCSIPGLPQLTFLDANGPVQTSADLPGAKFMHPGPQVLPITLQPKHSVTTGVRWVSGPVFQDNLCYKLTGVTIALRHNSAMTPLTGQMCGERSKGVHYDLQRYSTPAN